MAKWKCNMCGRELESEIEPTNCPCGSEKIEQEEEKSKLEKFLEKLF